MAPQPSGFQMVLRCMKEIIKTASGMVLSLVGGPTVNACMLLLTLMESALHKRLNGNPMDLQLRQLLVKLKLNLPRVIIPKIRIV